MDHYGTEWRPWPGGCKCHGDGAGYFMDYRRDFDQVFDVVDTERFGRVFMGAAQRVDGSWGWWFGMFSWTPDGDLLSASGSGTNATRGRAEATCREAVSNYGRATA